MKFIRPVIIITLLLVIMLLLAGCGQRPMPRNSTAKNPWNQTTPKPGGAGSKTTIVPTTTSPFIPATVTPTVSPTPARTSTYRPEPPVANLTANLTLLDSKNLVFTYNKTAYTYTLTNPPLLIGVTLTVPNITRTRVQANPVSGSDETITITYPDPVAFFEVTVKDLETNRIIARGGYGGQYDVSYTKKVWVRYPGTYYIEFSGNRLSADVDFLAPNQT